MSLYRVKYLLCYDIKHPRRLKQIHRLVRDWGLPVQFSVFEIELMPSQLEKLLTELTELIDVSEDKVMLYRLSPNQERIGLGSHQVTNDVFFI